METETNSTREMSPSDPAKSRISLGKKIDVKKVLITLALVLFAAGATGGGVYYVLNQNFKKEREANEKALNDIRDQLKNVTEKEKVEPATTISDVPVYKNIQYGFQLTLTNNWKDYKVLEKKVDMGSFSTTAWYFEMPVSDTSWQTAASTHDAGYASLFAIAVYTKAQWDAVQTEEGPKDSYVGEVGNYVFGYSHAQDGTDELSAPNSDITNILKSFKKI